MNPFASVLIAVIVGAMVSLGFGLAGSRHHSEALAATPTSPVGDGLLDPDLDAKPAPDPEALTTVRTDLADPTQDPAGVLKQALYLVQHSEWGKLAALLVVACVMVLRRYKAKLLELVPRLDAWWFDPVFHLLVAMAGGLAHHAMAAESPGWRMMLTGVVLAGISYLTTLAGTWAKKALGGEAKAAA